MRSFCNQPAGNFMVFTWIREVRHLLAANLFDMWATRVEGTASRQANQRGRAARHAFAHMLLAKLGQRVDQELGVGMERLAKDLLGRPLFNNSPRIHDTNA